MDDQAKDEWPTAEELQSYATAHNPVLSQAMQFLSYITTTIQLYVTVTGAAWTVVSGNTLGVGSTVQLWILAMHIALSIGIALALLGIGNNFIQRLNFAQWLGVAFWPRIIGLSGYSRAWAGVPADDLSTLTVKTFEEWKAGRTRSGFKSWLPPSLQKPAFILQFRAFQSPSLRFQRLWFLVPIFGAVFSAWLFSETKRTSEAHKEICGELSLTLSFRDSAPVSQTTFDRARYFFDKAGCSVEEIDVDRLQAQKK